MGKTTKQPLDKNGKEISIGSVVIIDDFEYTVFAFDKVIVKDAYCWRFQFTCGFTGTFLHANNKIGRFTLKDNDYQPPKKPELNGIYPDFPLDKNGQPIKVGSKVKCEGFYYEKLNRTFTVKLISLLGKGHSDFKECDWWIIGEDNRGTNFCHKDNRIKNITVVE